MKALEQSLEKVGPAKDISYPLLAQAIHRRLPPTFLRCVVYLNYFVSHENNSR